MKVAAVITEYNPFHLGHQYQLNHIKKITGSDAVVVLMSGNVVQRGEFAIIDKWHRAEVALSNGADLVLELPLLASLQSADYFAHWSIKILHELNVDNLLFGTESASVEEISQYVEWLNYHRTDIDKHIKDFLGAGYSYAASYQMAVDSIDDISKPSKFSISAPNHLLGIQYIQALNDLNSSMKAYALPRIKLDKEGTEILSGSQIRKLYRNGELLDSMVPNSMYEKLVAFPKTELSNYYDLLKYQILSQGANRLTQYFGIEDGLETYIYHHVADSSSFEDLINSLTSKRWTKASIQRKLMMILLNITKSEWQESKHLNETKTNVRILGYTGTGREIIKANRQNEKVHLFSNLTQDIAKGYHLNLRADTIYSMNTHVKLTNQNTGRFPIHF